MQQVACESMEPVSRTWTSKVGPGRFIQQYRGIKKRLRRAAKRTSPPTKTFVFYSRRHLRMNLALIPLLGNVAWETKIFLRARRHQLVTCVRSTTVKPVSRKRTSNIGLVRLNPTIPPNQEKTKEGSKWNINAHKLFCVLLEISSMHEPSS